MTTLTEQRLPIIKEHAGALPGKEIAEILGISIKNLSFICSKHKISLKLKDGSSGRQRKSKPDDTIDTVNLPVHDGAAPATITPPHTPSSQPEFVEPTEEQIAHLRAIAGTMPAKQARQQIGLPRPVVDEICTRYGISLRQVTHNKPTTKDLLMPHLDEIKSKAGKVATNELAQSLNVTPGQLANFCHVMKISLALPKAEQERLRKKTVKSTASDEELETCSRVLRAHGWTVLRPDPFRTLIDAPGQKRHAQRGGSRGQI